ncbi:MAG: IS3 family transposase [Planctomycetia bacterium]|nr:IS3 family transposase [Planctomycetia bacterium]
MAQTKGGQEMPRGKKFTAEQIIGKLREAEVELARGKTVPEVVRKLGVTEQTSYRWKREYGGLRTDQAKRRQTVEHVRDTLGRDAVTERRACRVLGQARNTQRRKACVADDEPQLVKRIVWMASEYGRYGYRRITALLRAEGWWVNHKQVERIWRQEGLKVPAKQPKGRRLWLGDGSCIRLRPTHRNHVWSYDFVMDRTADGRVIRMLTIVDEFTRECLAIDVERKLTSEDVLERLSDLFVRKGVPDHIRSENGSEFTAKRVREWLERVGVKTLSIEPGSPWENGYVESFNGKLRLLQPRPERAGTRAQFHGLARAGDLRHGPRRPGLRRALAVAAAEAGPTPRMDP